MKEWEMVTSMRCLTKAWISTCTIQSFCFALIRPTSDRETSNLSCRCDSILCTERPGEVCRGVEGLTAECIWSRGPLFSHWRREGCCSRRETNHWRIVQETEGRELQEGCRYGRSWSQRCSWNTRLPEPWHRVVWQLEELQPSNATGCIWDRFLPQRSKAFLCSSQGALPRKVQTDPGTLLPQAAGG